MNKKYLMIGGGALLLVVLYLAMRPSSAGAETYMIPPSSPADPNVLAAQVQQDSIKGQIALASINAAGTLDVINAQARGDVLRIDASYAGQSGLARINGSILQALAALQNQPSHAVPVHDSGGSSTVSQPTAPAQPPSSPSAPWTAIPWHVGGTSAPAQQQYQAQASTCWWRTHVPVVGAFMC